jgi:hypothetical protein
MPTSSKAVAATLMNAHNAQTDDAHTGQLRISPGTSNVCFVPEADLRQK